MLHVSSLFSDYSWLPEYSFFNEVLCKIVTQTANKFMEAAFGNGSVQVRCVHFVTSV